ncbi:MAG: enoyl-CoA hydratase/isomerase family protein [Gammaproteobacteria bacterium]|nr:enoyl-CoA hydratase/isomerase family protein [Gammaproteobacteria bacterium]
MPSPSKLYQGYERLKFDYPADRILRITISRPEKYNALDIIGHRELTYVWREVDADDGIDCVVITGEGKAFSAGGDFGMIEQMTTDYRTLANTWKEAKDLVYNLINCGKPTISSINGPAVGAGLVAALLCDISIAAKSVFITDGHTRLGVAAGDHAVILWPLLCGMAKAKYYLMTCDRMPAEEAERIGLLSMCVEDGELEAKTMEVAAKIASGAPNAIRWTKYALNNWLRMAGPSFDASTALEMLGFLGPEGREGLQALQEKRAPDFPKDSPI